VTVWTSVPKNLGAQDKIQWWLRQQPGLADYVRWLAMEAEEGDLVDSLRTYLFTDTEDNFLVNDLGASPTLRNITAASITLEELDAIDWPKVREELRNSGGAPS